MSNRNADGLLTHILDWTHDSFIAGQYYEIPDGRAKFSMTPAINAESLYVIFCIYNADGSGYSLEPIPYADACAAE